MVDKGTISNYHQKFRIFLALLSRAWSITYFQFLAFLGLTPKSISYRASKFPTFEAPGISE